MALEFVAGVIRITNMLIAIFILLYAYLFLIKTSRRHERRPWDYLFVSAFIFLMYQIFLLVLYFAQPEILSMNSAKVGLFVEFIFSGLVLLAFVSQHDLISKSPLILISRKQEDKDKK
ncbi:hypothetical protein ACFL1B_05585 [Nanoarchaeota archaeon]